MSVGDESQPSLTRLLCDVVFHSRRYVVPADKVVWRHSRKFSTWLNLGVLQPCHSVRIVLIGYAKALLGHYYYYYYYYFVM